MNTSETAESKLKKQLHLAEQNLEGAVVQQLARGRANAISQQNHWAKEYFERMVKGYRGLMSASVITAAFAAVVLLPSSEKLVSGNESGLTQEDSVTLLMEDPEFYLWLDKSGMLVAER